MKKIKETMNLSISEVFEKMFFLFLEPLDGESVVYDKAASIRFKGPVKGELRILLSEDIARIMVQNMLGLEEEEVTARYMEDCSKEAANMVCGDFLGKFDGTRVFNLSTPSFLEISGNVDPSKNFCRSDFDSDGKKVGVMLELVED
jgi:CheY-specific phosphatase CheX